MVLADRLALVASLQIGLGGPLDCHVYALRGDRGVILIDAGFGSHTDVLRAQVQRWCDAAPITTILLTHAHPDHCGGAAALRAATGCQIVAPAPSRRIIETGDPDASGLGRAAARGLYPPDAGLTPCPVDLALHDAERFTADGITFTAFHVRGHSPDAFCYLTVVEDRRWLFAGDVIFYGGMLGVVNAEGSGMEGYRADLGKLRGLAIDGLFPGHGLFTLQNGQRHIDRGLAYVGKEFLGPQIGQGDIPL